MCNFIPSFQFITMSTRDYRPRLSYKFILELTFFMRLFIVSMYLVHQREWKKQQRDGILPEFYL